MQNQKSRQKKNNEAKELIYNLKLMAFINQKILNKYYNKILIKSEKEFEDYLKYFESQWINKSKLGK